MEVSESDLPTSINNQYSESQIISWVDWQRSASLRDLNNSEIIMPIVSLSVLLTIWSVKKNILKNNSKATTRSAM